MKMDVANYIARCMECQRLKVEHRHLVGLLQPLPILEWKCEVLTVEFITKFPKMTRKYDSIMVVVDKLTKFSHFIPVKLSHKTINIVDIYMKEIAMLHVVHKEIVLDKYPKVTSNFWKGLFKGFGTNLNFSTTYHPQTYGKIDRVNKVSH
jgi:hypothetical protein